MKIKTGLVILIISTFMLSSCICIPKNQKEKVKVTQLQESILSKEAKITELQNLLADKERQINEKDSKIEELRKKLEMFGVFEK